jgi:uncharacterized MAPEG superfamily protein
MKNNPELLILVITCLLTLLMWIPYVVARTVKAGLQNALASPTPVSTIGPMWAQRARLAHANAVENLAIFAPLVLTASTLNVSNTVTLMAAKIYLIARVIHYVMYIVGIPVLRTLAFLTGFGATLCFAMAILVGST